MQYENEDIASIAAFLASTDEQNVLVGLELLKHQETSFDSLVLHFLLLEGFFKSNNPIYYQILKASQDYLNRSCLKIGF